MSAFGSELRMAREYRKLSQRQLAFRSGLSYRAIGYLEHGRSETPTADTLVRLAKATNGYWVVDTQGIHWREQ
jgi:transcriptional regulator with XRE-family HTH domain